MRGYIYLFTSILFEVAGSAFLKLSNGFTELTPSLLLVVFYVLSFAMIILSLKTISLSVGYSIWAGLGTAGAALVGVFLFNELLSSINIIGLIIIIIGVVIMNIKKESECTHKAHST